MKHNAILKCLLKHGIALLFAIVGVVFPFHRSLAAFTPAGTRIISTSSAEYFFRSNRFITYSNSVVTAVTAVYAVRLTPPGTVPSPAFTLQGYEGDTLYATFTIDNLGNAADSVSVGHALVQPSTVGLADVILFNDTNGNGMFDAGEDDPAFLYLSSGATVDLDAGFVLDSGVGVGDSYVEIRATSTNDTEQSQSSVTRVMTLGPSNATLHLGPFHNAAAQPGGEGSPDDVTSQAVGYASQSITFRNDVMNGHTLTDIVHVQVADSVGWPPGVTVTFQDTSGQALLGTPVNPNSALLGSINPGETRSLLVTVSSLQPFAAVVSDSLTVRLMAGSLIDSNRVNETIDRIIAPSAFNPVSVLQLKQTFRENVAGFGDVVTMIVSVQNISDSVLVNDVEVSEHVQPALDFVSSSAFKPEDGLLLWQAGTLQPGERHDAVIKFTVNSRVRRGETRVTGSASGIAITGAAVHAGPAVNKLLIDNDIFSDEGVILGEVFIDDNENHSRDPGEGGVGGVAIFVDDGEYTVSDSLGKFSLPRISSGYRVVRLDKSTLPDDTELLPPDSEQELRADWRLVHLLASGNAVVSFPVKKHPAVVDSVSRKIMCQELVTIQRQATVAYQIPSIPSSNFETGKAYLRTEYLERLNPIRKFLSRNPGWLVTIEGHTDSIPIRTADFPSNFELSIARARSVMRYLTANGIPRHQMIVNGYGDTRPIAPNSTAAGRAENRRVEIGFIPAEMRVEDPSSFRRIRAELAELSSLPDSFRVHILWDITTDSPIPFDVDLSFDIPERLHVAQATVRLGDADITPTGGHFSVLGFQRSRRIRCDIQVETIKADTLLVRDITLQLLRAVCEAASEGNATPPRGLGPAQPAPPDAAITLHAMSDKRHAGREHTFTLSSWIEPVEETSMRNHGGAFAVDPSLSSVSHDSVAMFGFTAPWDGAVFSRADQIPVQVRVPLGSRVELRSNGHLVPQSRMGRKVVYTDVHIEEITFYGVRIESGWNTLTVKAKPVRGEEKTDSIRVALASRPAALDAEEARLLIAADGLTRETVRIRVLDEVGLPVVDGIVGTVVEGAEVVQSPDARPGMPGLQVVTDGGYFTLDIAPMRLTGRHLVTVETHDLHMSVEVAFVPPRRRLFLSGIAQGMLGAFETSGKEDPLGLEHYHDGVHAEGDMRFFVQGTSYAGINLTARVDTRKRYDDPLLKTMNVDREHGVYGDASQLFFAAPAQGGNYVALEKDESYARYGDFRTPFTDGEFLRYLRSSTGVDAALVSGDDNIKVFVTDTDFRTVHDEIPGDGTSGFYYLSSTPVVENSINISIEVRDRFQLERILEKRPLVLNRDYTVNYFNGAVLFKQPIPARTPEFNPVTIVAIYEVETPNDSEPVYGVRGQLAHGHRYRLAAQFVGQGDRDLGYSLSGFDGSASLGNGFEVFAEFAHSDDDLMGLANAYRVGGAYKNRRNEHSLYYRRVEKNFSNPTWSGHLHERFTRKLGFESRIDISEHFRLQATGYDHDLEFTDEEIRNLYTLATYRRPALNFSAGLRAARQRKTTGRQEGYLSVLGAGVERAGRFETRAHWEHNLDHEGVDEYPDRLDVHGAVAVFSGLMLRLNYEYLTPRGMPAMHRLLAGLESPTGRGSSAYTKYSMHETAGDRRLGAMSGIRQKFRLGPRLLGSLDIEGFRSFSETLADEYVTAKTGLNWLKRNVALVEGQYEIRWQHVSTRHLIRFNAIRQMRGGFAMALRKAFSYTNPEADKASIYSEGQLTGAYRPVASRFKSLLTLKSLYDRFSPVDPGAVTWRLVVAADINFAPVPAQELRLKVAFKRVEDYSTGISATSNNHLLLAQYVHSFKRHWDIDLWGRYLGQNGMGTNQLGIGIELGRAFFNQVRVAAGYSINGFEEQDMAVNDAWAKGFGLRVQLILSDWIFDGLRVDE